MDYCAITNKKNTKLNSCFNYNDLVNISNAYNNWNKSICNKGKCLENTRDEIDTTLSEKQLYKQLKQTLKKICKNDYCWLDLEFIKKMPVDTRDKILYFTYKPKQPKTNETLFNTVHINTIMQQYQEFANNKRNKHFIFLGAVPADISRLEEFNLPALKSYKQIGIIMNTDTYKKPGEHWVSCFIDNRKSTVEYFDSLGKNPNKYIKEFLYKFKDYSLVINKKAHQTFGINCGAYAVYFLINRLKGKSLKDINKNNITDRMMTFYRKKIFRPYT